MFSRIGQRHLFSRRNICSSGCAALILNGRGSPDCPDCSACSFGFGPLPFDNSSLSGDFTFGSRSAAAGGFLFLLRFGRARRWFLRCFQNAIGELDHVALMDEPMQIAYDRGGFRRAGSGGCFGRLPSARLTFAWQELTVPELVRAQVALEPGANASSNFFRVRARMRIDELNNLANPFGNRGCFHIEIMRPRNSDMRNGLVDLKELQVPGAQTGRSRCSRP